MRIFPNSCVLHSRVVLIMPCVRCREIAVVQHVGRLILVEGVVVLLLIIVHRSSWVVGIDRIVLCRYERVSK